ncbi:MAG: chromosome partitioning protein ParB [Bryobacterales bacterium]|nr:chromosome partitioning protein ParB [Bryobacterales bacterium]
MNKNDGRKALGKGLHSLLPPRNAPAAVAAAAPAKVEEPEGPVDGRISVVPIASVEPNPNQPRRDFDPVALAELSQSIERDGIIQPILVRRAAPNRYQIIAGERRWRAASAAGLSEIPVILRTANDEKVLELAIVENIQREDLNPVELAQAFQRMMTELELTHEEIGAKTGKDRATIANTIRLLHLPEEIQALVSTRKLTQGHARALLKLPGADLQREVADKAIQEGWSVRQIEEYTRPAPAAAAKPKPAPPSPALDPNVKAAISEMETRLGTKVRLVEKSREKGQIEIEYYSPSDLERIYELIVGQLTD